MRRILFTFMAIFWLGVASLIAQSALKGIVKDSDTGNPLEGVIVKIGGSSISAKTNSSGEYTLEGVSAGKHIIEYSLINYQTYITELEVSENMELPEVLLKRSQIEEGQNLSFAEITISSDDLDSDAKDQSVSGLLQSSQDAFNSAVAYTFSPARFLVRGYESEYSLLYLNGVPVNDPESGFAAWSSWGGLNDVTRNRESRNGLTPAGFSFGGLGGASYINTRASQQRKGTRMSYALTNRTYTSRLMFTHSTGLMNNGFAFTVSGSRRWAEEGYVPGTNYDAWAYFIGIEKKINSSHTLALTAFNAPTKRAMQGLSVDEANELIGSNYYNPNWGYQNGEKRNARIRFQQEPTFILNHYWNISSDMVLNTAAGYSFGTYQTTSLNWYDAQDPRPDYYRKLPSYWIDAEQETMDEIAYNFSTDPRFSQLDWDYLYQTNYNSLDTLTDLLRSKYIIENRITDSRQFTLSSTLNWAILPELKLNTGFSASVYKGRNYKEIDDLLGGQFWRDIDQFIERDFFDNPDLAQNDLDNPNRQVVPGDKFGYDYIANVNNGGLWAVLNYLQNRFEYYLGASLNYTEFWRTGEMRNGRFPNDSKGDSEKQKFNDYAIKGGLTWKISGRHYIDGNLAYMTRAPFFRNSYISPRTSNFVIPGLTSERVASADLNYNLRTPYIKARLTVYYTLFKDQTELKSFYDDTYRTFVNYTMRNMDKVHKGIELGAEIKISPTLTLNTAAAFGSYQFISHPLATVTQDNLGSVLALDQVVYIKNFFVPNTPQTVATLGFRYASPKYWFFGASYSYFADSYIDFAPGKRTAEALVGLEPEDPRRIELTRQIKVDPAFLLDANIGKSWRIKNYFINLNFQIANILDKTDFKTGGFEQSRYSISEQTSNKFPPKYFYAYGRTYYLILGFRF